MKLSLAILMEEINVGLDDEHRLLYSGFNLLC
jgi:hypothetical protein